MGRVLRGWPRLWLTVLPPLLAAAAPPPAPRFSTPLPNHELAAIRGKFLLPNGAEIALAVQTDTLVDGRLALRSVFTVDGAVPTLAVFTGQAGAAPRAAAAAGSGQVSSAVAPPVTVMIDRIGQVRTITPEVRTANMPTVTVSSSAAATSDAIAVTPVPAVVGGDGVATPAGVVTLLPLANGTRIALAGDGIDVSHLVGQAFGSVVANAGNDRTIDTTTSVNIDLRNAGMFATTNAALRIETIALDATRALVR